MWTQAITLSLLLNAAGAGSQGIALDDLKHIFAAMESSIQDVRVEYEWYIDPPITKEDIAGTSNLREVSRGHRTFTTARPFLQRHLSSTMVDLEDEQERQFTMKSKQSYNGAVAKQLSHGGWPDPVLDGTITKRTDFIPSWTLSPMGFTILRFYPNLLSEDLGKNTSGFTLERDIQKVNGFNTICLARVLPDGGVYERTYLSVDHGYAPVKFAYVSPKTDKINWSADVLELKEVSEGVWFPVKGVIPDSNNVYEAREVLLNRDLPLEHFDIEFPPGTRVVDEIAGIQYAIQPDEEVFDRWLEEENIVSAREKPLNVSAGHEAEGELVRRTSDQVTGPPAISDGVSWGRYAWAIVAILMIIVAGVVFIIRRAMPTPALKANGVFSTRDSKEI